MQRPFVNTTLPLELWTEVEKYRQTQRDYAPTGAVPAYLGTYLQYLERFLRQEIQMYITSCEGLRILSIRRIRPEYAHIRGIAVTQWGDESVFILRIYRKDVPRLAKELEEMSLGQREDIAFKGSRIARIDPPSIGLLVFGSYRPSVVQYCREVIEAVARAMALIV